MLKSNLSTYAMTERDESKLTPLPWRQCAPLILLGSLVFYGLGFLVAAGFHHVLAIFQP
jgi:hypothetical protein